MSTPETHASDTPVGNTVPQEGLEMQIDVPEQASAPLEPADAQPEPRSPNGPETGSEHAENDTENVPETAKNLPEAVPGQEQEPQAKDEPAPVDLEKARAEFQENARNYLIEQSRHVVIPSFAQWFDLNSVHDIERKLFPDFFPAAKPQGDLAPVSVYKTEETYRNMRDFIVNTYRINPVEYLTVTAVRRNLAGDVALIIRVHRFLEKWGLINYQIDPRTKPSLVGPQYTGHFQITLDTPKGLTPFVPQEVEVSAASSAHAPSSNGEATLTGTAATSATADESAANVAVKAEPGPETIPLNIDVTRNVFDDSKTAKTPATVTYVCNETANDISDVRYHNLKSKALAGGSLGPLVISKECYEQGLFPLNFSAADFVKLEASKLSDWTRQELLLLLEGIEMYGSIDNNAQSLFVNSNAQWDKISEHVALKSREECLVKFLHLPIEDRYLQKLVRGEEKDVLEDGFSKDTVIQEVVAKLVESLQGQQLLAENAQKNLQQLLLDQTNLVNQVIELTVAKFEAKTKHIERLERELAQKESFLSAQRKQVLVERWMNFEKISKFRETNTNPELAPLLDDLLVPVSISEINNMMSKTGLDASEQNTVQESVEAQEDAAPVSLAAPKAYQFWSA